MENENGRPSFRPSHPGELLKEDILPNLKMSIKDLADHLGVTRQSLSDLLNQKRGVSNEMAIRLGKAFENGARFWLAMQMQYDLWEEERKSTVQVAPISWNKGEAA